MSTDKNTTDKKKSRYQIDGKRGDFYYVDPEQVFIVTDPTDPLYDPDRVNLPIHEPTVRSMMVDGVEDIVDITKRKDDDGADVFAVMDGRQRVKNLIEARRRLRTQGVEDKDLPKLPVRLKRGDAKRLAGVGHTRNSLRQNDGILTQARKMAHYMDTTGADEAEASIKFGCNKETVKNRIKLLELDHAVHQAIEKGEINVTGAMKLHGLSPADQQAKLKELKETMRSSDERNGEGARKVRDVTRTTPEPRGPGRVPRSEPERRKLMRQAMKGGRFDAEEVQKRTRKPLKWDHFSKVMGWLLDPEIPDDDVEMDVPGGKAFIEEFGRNLKSLLTAEREAAKKKAAKASGGE